MGNKSIDIYIQNQRLDLFEDENIVVNSSVQNINDISKVFTDFSQSFTVPASQDNNRIFQHWYNAEIDEGFDARTKKGSSIEISKLPFKEGQIRLENAKVADGQAISYKLTFFGNLVNISDLFGDDELGDMDFSEYDHTYNPSNVKMRANATFSNKDFIYPLIGTKRRWYYNSDASDNTFLENLSNIALHSDSSTDTHGIDWTELRPAIKVKTILDKIQTTYGLTFSNDFFAEPVFDNLYLWLHNTDVSSELSNSVVVTNYESVGDFQQDKGTFNNSTGRYVTTDRGSFLRRIEVRVDSSDGKPYTVQIMNKENVLTEKTGTGDIDINLDLPAGVEEGSEIHVRFKASSAKLVDSINMRIKELSDDTVLFVVRNADVQITDIITNTAQFFPNMKVKSFFTGLVKLFNLAIIPTGENQFLVDTLDSWYSNGEVYDITRYIDSREHEVSRGNVLSGLDFSFQEEDTILIETYRKLNGYQYGDTLVELKDQEGKKLDGDPLEIEVDFGQMIFERLTDVQTNSLTNIQIGSAIDADISATETSPLLFYAIEQDLQDPLSYYLSETQQEDFGNKAYMPSHVNEFTSKDFSTVFNAELDEYDSTLITNSLFKLYYEDYVTDIFDPKRRKYTYRARLPQHLVCKIRLNDRLLISGVRYIINNMEINLTSNLVKLELLNDIYEFIPSNPSPQTIPIALTNGTTVQEACDSTDFTTYYIVEDNFTNATGLYVDSFAQTQANEAWYSDGNLTRFFNTSNGLLENDTLCPSSGEGTAFDISLVGTRTGIDSCDLSINTQRYFSGEQIEPLVNDVIYADLNQTQPFNGDFDFYKISESKSIRISNLGVVTEVFFCSGGVGGAE